MKEPGTSILWPLRVWLVIEVFFGLGAILTIAIDPANAKTNFAWDIQPTVMAAVLGAYYISAAPLSLLSAFARRWEMVRVIILPTVIFTTVELITTLVHLGRFSVGTPPFVVWFLSYLLPPPILGGLYVLQERRARKVAAQAPTEPLAADARLALLHIGILLTALAIFFFLIPQALISIAPWTMTPLTVRAFTPFLLAAGTLMLSMWHENDRTRVLVGTPLLMLMFPLTTIQIARFADQVNFRNGALFVGYGLILAAFILGVYLARADWRKAFR